MNRQTDYDYIAYIDEAGETGLTKIATRDDKGSSEWLILSATVIAARREQQVLEWSRQITNQCSGRQSKTFHFRKANDNQQIAACEFVSGLPVRHFVVCCHKRNMRGYSNPAAARANEHLAGYSPQKTGWFYYWPTRLLLERVTEWVKNRSLLDYGEPRQLYLEFSERGGVRYDEMSGYLIHLKDQAASGTTYLTRGQIDWDVLAPDSFSVFRHYTRAGLVMPDIVASAFFKAVEKHTRPKGIDTRMAKALAPRMATQLTRAPSPYNFGVKLMPHENVVRMDADQKQIFQYYGYVFPTT